MLSDLKATYKWLNENVDEISSDIKNANSKEIFLNVDNPNSDQWVWHSASTLVKDLHDVGDLHDVKGFLRKYDSLLEAAGVRTIHKTTAKPVAATDRTSLHRSRFCELRERGFEVNVTFKTVDEEHQTLLNEQIEIRRPGASAEDPAEWIEAFLPLDLESQKYTCDLPSRGLGKGFCFATEGTGNFYWVPLSDTRQPDAPVFFVSCDPRANEKVAESLDEFLSWPRTIHVREGELKT